MTIAFEAGSTLGQGSFIQVLRSGLRLGRIFQPPDGIYRFYEGDVEKLGGADLQDGNLDQLKAAIVRKYTR